MNDNPLREDLGRAVRLAWIAYCQETGDTKPAHLAPWEDLSEWDKEADRRIGVALAHVIYTRLVMAIEGLALLSDPAVVKSPQIVLMDVADRIRRFAPEEGAER